MKKIAALFLVLMLTLGCAMAENIPHFDTDPSMIVEEGNYLPLAQFDIQLFVPADFVSYELSAQAMSEGNRVLWGYEDATLLLDISYADILSQQGNPIVSYEELAAFYQAYGFTAFHCLVNNMEAVFYNIPSDMLADGVNLSGMCFLGNDGKWLSLCAISVTEGTTQMGNVILFSAMPY